MSDAVEKLASEMLTLPADVRAYLAHKLISSLEEIVDANAQDEWNAVIDRRSTEIENNMVQCRPAADAIAEIRGKLDALRRQSSRG